MVLVNGLECRQLNVFDRGVQYGDGIFETVAVKNGIPLFLRQHLGRLVLGCQSLRIRFEDKDLSIVKAEIDELIDADTDGIVKIIITRGIGGRGYKPDKEIQPSRIICFQNNLPSYPDLERQGVAVILCRTRLGINRALAGIKHLNRLEQILASQEWDDENIHEGLMQDQEGFVVEGTKTNLFSVKNGALLTPKVDRCGVAGIVRSLIIQLATEHKLPFHETRLTVDAVSHADELFLTNSIVGVWPINRFIDTDYAVGSVTLEVQRLLSRRIQLELAK